MRSARMPLRFNRYNTSDPENLLELKQEEDQALLQVVRLIDPNIAPEELIFLVINTLQRQLDVHRLMILRRDTRTGQKFTEANFGLKNLPEAGYEELEKINRIRKLANSPFPGLKATEAEYIIPLGSEETMSAWILIADFAETEEETINDLMFIETIGSILAISLQNIDLFEEKLEAERMQRELELAGRIQRSSLPTRFDLLPQLEIFARSTPHSSIGGDFYNLLQTGPNELYFFIADAAGKGTAAALLITNITAHLNALIQTGASYHQMIHQLHRVIGQLTSYEAFVTLFLGKIDVAEGRLEYFNAGHNPPVLTRNGQQTNLTKGCIPLGIMDITEFDVGNEAFGPGDSLFLYTDGMVEQMNPLGDLLGEERINRFVEASQASTSQAVVKKAFRLVSDFADGEPFGDDITVMHIRHRQA